MSMFRHHPDGLIYLNDLNLPLAFWLQHEPAYFLPQGAIGREYVPNVRQTLSDGSSQWAGDLPWVEGDRYLAQTSTYEAAWTALNTPPIPTTPMLVPQWLQFNQAMLTNATYNRLIENGNQRMVDRLETMSISANENWTILKFFWDTIVEGQTGTADEVAALNVIASTAAMPFSFGSDLKMILA